MIDNFDIKEKIECVIRTACCNMYRISVGNVYDVIVAVDQYDSERRTAVDIHGGFNGKYDWVVYLEQLKEIMVSLNGSYIYNMDIDSADDTWICKIILSEDFLRNSF